MFIMAGGHMLAAAVCYAVVSVHSSLAYEQARFATSYMTYFLCLLDIVICVVCAVVCAVVPIISS